MKTPTPPIVLVLLGICIGTGFGWLLSSSCQAPVPVDAEPQMPPASAVVVSPDIPHTAPDLVTNGPRRTWQVAADEIRQYSGDAKEIDAILASITAEFPGNPTATVAILFAATEWADRVGDTSAKVRKESVVEEFDQYWLHELPWRMEALNHKASLYKMDGRPDMAEYCVRLMKREFDEHFVYFCARHQMPEERSLLEKHYTTALNILGRSGRKLDVLWNRDTYYDTSERRIFREKSRLFLSEMLRAPPEDSAYNWLADDASLSAEERTKTDEVQAILIRLLDQEADRFASDQNAETDNKTGNRGSRKHELPARVLTEEDRKELLEYDPVKASKEYRDLTDDPPLPKPGEKAPPKPPEEKLVPYLKDPTNKDPKANGLGLSLEALTDVTRADLGPLPFPLPLRLTGLEEARHPQPPPPGMISDRAKTQLTYKPRRALINNLKKQAGRDIPDNYGNVDAPLLYWASLEEYMAHKDNKEECYFLIGRNLEHAQRLLLADPIQIRRSGVGLAEVATMFLQTNMDDKPLAMAIMDLYVMPYLHLGDKRRENHLSKANLLVTAMGVYSWSDFPDKLQLAAEEATRESGDQNSQDAGRYAIAKALVRQKKIDEAITVLGQITDRSLADGAKSYIETIKKKHPPKP